MLNRRIGKVLLLALLPWCALPVPAQESGAVRLAQAWQRIDAYIRQQMSNSRTPGLALAVTSREGLLHLATFGYADRKARRPVTPETLFQIGSISKSFTAIALLQLREEGKLELDAPLTKYWPWFSVQSQHPPFTVHHLLMHTSGLPRDRDDIPSSPFSAWAVRERTTGSPPGQHWAYSNVGYQILGYLLEHLDGSDYATIIRKRIFAPLGMKQSVPVIAFASRARMAVGYQTAYDDRPAHRSHPLVEAPWFEYGAGDGSIAATPAELAAYLRMILNRGAAPAGRVLSDEGFQLFTQRTVEVPGRGWYGYGISIREEQGRTLLSHAGGMVGYSSMMLGDVTTGIGAVVFVNGPGNPGQVAEFVLNCVRAALRGEPLPPLPDPEPPGHVANAADYASTFAGPDGARLRFLADGEKLFLVRGEERIPLERRGPDRFYANHPDFALFPIVFRRAKTEKQEGEEIPSGPVVEVHHGAAWYFNEGYTGPRAFTVPAEWPSYAGHYRTTNPWLSNFRVLLRKGKLWLVFPPGNEEELVPLAPGLFRVGAEDESAERLRFDVVIEGRALRANLSGVNFYRTFTP